MIKWRNTHEQQLWNGAKAKWFSGRKSFIRNGRGKHHVQILMLCHLFIYCTMCRTVRHSASLLHAKCSLLNAHFQLMREHELIYNVQCVQIPSNTFLM